jgi:hypothetical protein
MNLSYHTSIKLSLLSWVGAVALCLSWLMIPVLSGQTAANFLPPGEKSADEELQEVKPVDSLPSRFAGADIQPYTGARAAACSMRNRETDPFGFIQDPSIKPEAKSPTRLPTKRQAALPPTPLSDIIKHIRVTTIMPGEKKFLVGIRSFSESDEFALVFNGKQMRMKIAEVSATRILFKNLDNGESAHLETGMLPPGMVAGGGAIQPPGMVSPDDDRPLDLGSQSPPES